jgi:hypothetical protein
VSCDESDELGRREIASRCGEPCAACRTVIGDGGSAGDVEGEEGSAEPPVRIGSDESRTVGVARTEHGFGHRVCGDGSPGGRERIGEECHDGTEGVGRSRVGRPPSGGRLTECVRPG